MTDQDTGGVLAGFIRAADRIMDSICVLFLILANASLALMLIGTAATIVLRPFNLGYYWIWPWTMQFFVWLAFFGFYVIYRRQKDIAVDFLMQRIGGRAMTFTRYFVILVTLVVCGLMLMEAGVILETQVGEIEGVILPGGVELERYTLSIPLFLSTLLIFINTLLDLLKALTGVPEVIPSHVQDPEG